MAHRSASVLVVDDDPMISSATTWLLQERGYRFELATTVDEALRALAGAHFDALLLDMYLPDGDGLAVLERALSSEPAPSVVMMTARADIKSAVEAMRRGASDFLEKPLDLEDVGARLDRALGAAAMRRKLAVYEAKETRERAPVAHSKAYADVTAVAERVAATPASSALLLGESGVGKEVLASRIHAMSDRRNGPFVRVNLAAMPESMIEAELFGSVRGAFTDSKRDRAGHFASADGGTLLLDEICELKVELQPKLLRVLEERRFYPVGSDRERRVDVRVLAATNRDPQQMIAQGHLREDLYYRLATVVLRIPPLRERAEDLDPLVTHFLDLFRSEFRRPGVRIAPAARAALLAYPWPGNVRELRNTVERAVMLARGDEIDVPDLGLPEAPAPSRASETTRAVTPEGAGLTLESAERVHITRVLEQCGGSKVKAAAMLGISRSTLWEKTKKYGLE